MTRHRGNWHKPATAYCILGDPYLHTWVGAHVAKILTEFHESVRREPLISLGASLGFVLKGRSSMACVGSMTC